MIDLIAGRLSLEFVDKLSELTSAKARQAFKVPQDITPNAHQRLIGHARQDALQEAFKLAAIASGAEVSDFRPKRGMPSRYVIDLGQFNLVAVKNNATRSSVELECKALAMIADESLSEGAEVVDLFTGMRIIQAGKPLIAWTAVWSGSKSRSSALPTWTGFTQLEATGESRVRAKGVGVSYGKARAAILERMAAPAAAQKKKPKFTPRSVPSEKVNNRDEE